jgi:hypothetical protein
MYTYQRLMRRMGATTGEQSERGELQEGLNSAPGLDEFTIIEMHPKGGYRVMLSLNDIYLNDFIAHLESCDWMAVL